MSFNSLSSALFTHVKWTCTCSVSLHSWRDLWAGERWRSRYIPTRDFVGGIREQVSGGGAAIFPWGISWAAKPQVKFPPATFRMVFACRPLLSLLMNQLNKPIRERSVTWNLRFISAQKESILKILATDEIHMKDRNHALAWTKPNNGLYNTRHNQQPQPCAWRATFESCGTRTIKGEINLYIEFQKHSIR